MNIKNTACVCWQKVWNSNTNKTRKIADLRAETVEREAAFPCHLVSLYAGKKKKENGLKAVFLSGVLPCIYTKKKKQQKTWEPSWLKKVVFSLHMTGSGYTATWKINKYVAGQGLLFPKEVERTSIKHQLCFNHWISTPNILIFRLSPTLLRSALHLTLTFSEAFKIFCHVPPDTSFRPI